MNEHSERLRLVVLSPFDHTTAETCFPGHELVLVDRDEDPVAACRGADAVIGDWTGHHRVSPAVVESFARTCRLVQTIGAGFDAIDVAACTAAGVPVATGAGMNADAVAEWCVWGAISAQRHLSAADRRLAQGTWDRAVAPSQDLANSTVGLLGLGSIGQSAARRFRAFGSDLQYWSRTRRPTEQEATLGVRWCELDDLFATSDVLVVVIALTDQTRGLVSRDALARMRPTAVLVNAGRGPIVDEDALAEALRAGRLHGAALDVFDTEPLPSDHRYRGLENVTLTPHLAGGSRHAIEAVLRAASENVQRVAAGQPPLRQVLEPARG